MRFVTTERAQPGMVLASPVTDRRGRLLIPAEACLTDRHIEALKLWGVPHIDVRGEEPEGIVGSPLPPEETADVEAEIEERFGSQTGHPFLAALRSCALDRAVQVRRASRARS